MNFKIKTSRIAYISLEENIKDIEKRWNKKEVNEFKLKVNDILNLLEKSPYTFMKWEFNEGIRKVKVSNFITLFYSINGKIIELLLFWNEKRNPNKLNNLL